MRVQSVRLSFASENSERADSTLRELRDASREEQAFELSIDTALAT
jgi:hypothetical protein